MKRKIAAVLLVFTVLVSCCLCGLHEKKNSHVRETDFSEDTGRETPTESELSVDEIYQLFEGEYVCLENEELYIKIYEDENDNRLVEYSNYNSANDWYYTNGVTIDEAELFSDMVRFTDILIESEGYYEEFELLISEDLNVLAFREEGPYFVRLDDDGNPIMSSVVTPAPYESPEGNPMENFTPDASQLVTVTGDDYSISNEVIADNDKYRITVINGGLDENGDVIFNLVCENKSPDMSLTFDFDYPLLVNGWANGYGIEVEVASGQLAYTILGFDTENMTQAGISTVDSVAMNVIVTDSVFSTDHVRSEHIVFYPTGLTEDQVVIPDRPHTDTEQVLVDDDQFTYVILGTEYVDSEHVRIYAYAENNTDKVYTFDWLDICIDDVELTSYVDDHSIVPAGARCLVIADIRYSDLPSYVVDEPHTLSFNFRIEEEHNWGNRPVYEYFEYGY